EHVDGHSHPFDPARLVRGRQDHAARRWCADAAGALLVRAAIAATRAGFGTRTGLRTTALARAGLLPERLRWLLRRLLGRLGVGLRLGLGYRLRLHHGLRLRLRLR